MLEILFIKDSTLRAMDRKSEETDEWSRTRDAHWPQYDEC